MYDVTTTADDQKSDRRGEMSEQKIKHARG